MIDKRRLSEWLRENGVVCVVVMWDWKWNAYSGEDGSVGETKVNEANLRGLGLVEGTEEEGKRCAGVISDRAAWVEARKKRSRVASYGDGYGNGNSDGIDSAFLSLYSH